MRPNIKTARLLCMVLILTVMITVTLEADSRLRVIVNNYANSKAKVLSNSVINQTVHKYLQDNNIKYSDLLKINTKEDGTVTSVEFDTVEMTKIKSGIISQIQKEVNAHNVVVMNIPVGTLTGNQFLNNRGPTVRIEMQISSAVYSKISSKFISAGINQTLHQITLSIRSDVYFIMPWYRSSGSFETE